MKKMIIMAAAFAILGAPSAFADHHGGHKLDKFDADGNGAISKEEFMKSAEERFSKMDTDGSGEISKEEGRAMKEKMRAKMQEYMEKRRDRRASNGAEGK